MDISIALKIFSTIAINYILEKYNIRVDSFLKKYINKIDLDIKKPITSTSDADYFVKHLPTGLRLKHQLKLEKFSNVYIRTSIGINPSIVEVIFDSVYDRSLSSSTIESLSFYKTYINNSGKIEKRRFTTARNIDSFVNHFESNSNIVMIDLAGKYYSKYTESILIENSGVLTLSESNSIQLIDTGVLTESKENYELVKQCTEFVYNTILNALLSSDFLSMYNNAYLQYKNKLEMSKNSIVPFDYYNEDFKVAFISTFGASKYISIYLLKMDEPIMEKVGMTNKKISISQVISNSSKNAQGGFIPNQGIEISMFSFEPFPNGYELNESKIHTLVYKLRNETESILSHELEHSLQYSKSKGKSIQNYKSADLVDKDENARAMTYIDYINQHIEIDANLTSSIIKYYRQKLTYTSSSNKALSWAHGVLSRFLGKLLIKPEVKKEILRKSITEFLNVSDEEKDYLVLMLLDKQKTENNKIPIDIRLLDKDINNFISKLLMGNYKFSDISGSDGFGFKDDFYIFIDEIVSNKNYFDNVTNWVSEANLNKIIDIYYRSNLKVSESIELKEFTIPEWMRSGLSYRNKFFNQERQKANYKIEVFRTTYNMQNGTLVVWFKVTPTYAGGKEFVKVVDITGHTRQDKYYTNRVAFMKVNEFIKDPQEWMNLPTQDKIDLVNEMISSVDIKVHSNDPSFFFQGAWFRLDKLGSSLVKFPAGIPDSGEWGARHGNQGIYLTKHFIDIFKYMMGKKYDVVIAQSITNELQKKYKAQQKKLNDNGEGESEGEVKK